MTLSNIQLRTIVPTFFNIVWDVLKFIRTVVIATVRYLWVTLFSKTNIHKNIIIECIGGNRSKNSIDISLKNNLFI